MKDKNKSTPKQRHRPAKKRTYIKKANGKNHTGCPPKYKTPEELRKKINAYFNSDAKIRKVLIGKAPNQTVVEIPVPTISGLAYYLGFESRQSFYDYEKDTLFSYTIKRARLFIEVEYEEQLQYGNVTGAILY